MGIKNIEGSETLEYLNDLRGICQKCEYSFHTSYNYDEIIDAMGIVLCPGCAANKIKPWHKRLKEWAKRDPIKNYLEKELKRMEKRDNKGK
jgi:hypothetical protein